MHGRARHLHDTNLGFGFLIALLATRGFIHPAGFGISRDQRLYGRRGLNVFQLFCISAASTRGGQFGSELHPHMTK
jgi:hypothetical protein